MSNVFTYPNNPDTNYINDNDSILLGALKRANTFLNGGNNEDVPYAKPYINNNTRFVGFTGASRTPENLLRFISQYRTYYGVASQAGKNGYPTYRAVYEQPLVETYFHQIQFRVTGATATNPLTLDCRRDATSHPNAPSFTATDTHGMGDDTFAYTDVYPRQFNLTGFDTAVAGEWGNVLNDNDYYLKVVDAQTVEVYEDEDYLTPVDASGWTAYTSGGLCKINLQTVNEITTTTTFDPTTVYKGFGRTPESIRVDGDRVVVSARSETAVVDRRSHIYVFNRQTRNLISHIDPPASWANTDLFGYSVAISGNILVVGGTDTGDPLYGGVAFIYNADTGALLHTLFNPNPDGQDNEDDFGYSVATDGTLAIIGARNEGSNTGQTTEGKVYVFDVATGSLVRTINNPLTATVLENREFGASVAVNNDFIIVGDPDAINGSGVADGKVHVFNKSTGTLAYTINNPFGNLNVINSRFGRLVEVNGSVLLVSSHGRLYSYTLGPSNALLIQADIGGGDASNLFATPSSSIDVKGIFGVRENVSYDVTTKATTATYIAPDGTDLTFNVASAIDNEYVYIASSVSDRIYVFGRSSGNYLHDLIPPPRTVTTTTVEVEGQPYTYQLLAGYLQDYSNRFYTYYDKDYYSGAGNSVNNDFGAYRNGARAQFYVFKNQANSTFFNSQTPIDHATVNQWWYNSDYNPVVTITTNADGQVANNNGYVNGITLDPKFGGLMALGGTDANPYQFGALAAVLVQNKDSDPVSGFNFTISNITQADPAVITFANSVKDTSADGNANASMTINGVQGMTEINGRLIYLKQTSHNTAEVYTDAACTVGLDSTGFTAYTSGGNLQDYDDNDFVVSTVFGGNFYGRTFSNLYSNFGPLDVDYAREDSIDQIWPQTVSPAKIDITLVQPTRKTYAQDLTRYTNSTGAYGYRLSVTYNNISKDAWRIIDAFIKQMRGGSAPFIFNFSGNFDGNGYIPFETSSTTLTKWQNNDIRVGKRINPGDTQVYFMGFDPSDSAVCQSNDVFFGLHTYSDLFTLNNVAFAGGTFGANQFGEAIIRFTHPVKNSVSALNRDKVPAVWNRVHCQLSEDEVEYDWHPTGRFVSFTVDMDMI